MLSERNRALLAEEGGVEGVVGVCGGVYEPPRNIIPWYGGTARMAAPIAAMVEMINRDCWVEACGGAAGVTMKLRLRKLEIYNDLNDGLCNLFQVVRNPRQRAQLMKLLRFTLYSETEWRMCYRGWRAETDPIEKARMFYVAVQQAMVAKLKGSAWRRDGIAGMTNNGYPPTLFYNSLKNIVAVSRRFRNVQVSNRPAIQIIEAYNDSRTTIFIDTPYLEESRQSTGQYDHEMSIADHTEILNYVSLPTTKAAIIVKHYPAALYKDTLESAGFKRFDYAATASSALQSSRNGLKGADPKKFKRVECLWLNEAAYSRLQPSLIDLMDGAA